MIDLFKPVLAAFAVPSHPPMTTDGIHLNPYGYWRRGRDSPRGDGVRPAGIGASS